MDKNNKIKYKKNTHKKVFLNKRGGNVMATRSYIGLYDGKKMEYVYCHYDGYFSHVGLYLLLCYQNVNKIKELISLGDLHSLGNNVAPPRKLQDKEDAYYLSYACSYNIKTSFTTAFMRDLGDLQRYCHVCFMEGFDNLDDVIFKYYYSIPDKKWYFKSKKLKCRDDVPLKGYELKKIFEDYNTFNKVDFGYETWEVLQKNYREAKDELKGVKGSTIIDTFNKYIDVNGKYMMKLYEFGYKVDKENKRIYGLYKKPEEGKKNRKLVASSPIIGDLLNLLADSEGVLPLS